MKGTAPAKPAEGLVRSAAGRSPPAVRHGRSHRANRRCGWIIWNSSPSTRRKCCARTRGCMARPIGLIANRRGFLKTSGGPAHRRHRLHRIRAQGGVLRRDHRAPGFAADLFAGRLGIHGGRRSGKRGHHSRGRRDGGSHGVRDRAQDHRDAESCFGRRILRDGRAGIRSELHLRLAHRADRRDGWRRRGAGGAWTGTGTLQVGGAAGSAGAGGSHRADSRRLRKVAGRPLCCGARSCGCDHRSAGNPARTRIRAGSGHRGAGIANICPWSSL